MSLPVLAELPYRHDSGELFEAIADRPWAVFLDSGQPYGTQGRYDVLGCDPMVTLTTRGAVTEIRSSAGAMLSPQDPFALLREQLGTPAPGVAGLPFCGGAIGYFAYDLARRLAADGLGVGALLGVDFDVDARVDGQVDGIVEDQQERQASVRRGTVGGEKSVFTVDAARRLEAEDNAANPSFTLAPATSWSSANASAATSAFRSWNARRLAI